MARDVIPFGPGELVFIAIYLCSLLLFGWLGRKAQREKSLHDFYLGGRSVGFLVLLLTLYATQYSGNTLFGFTGKTYRVGYLWTVCVHFMTAVVVCLTLIAPGLHRLSVQHRFLTPADYLFYRFRSRNLCLAATVIMVVSLANYLLAQLKVMGEALRGFLPQYGDEAYIWGVVILAVIIVVYETLGGFRAVVWTDVVQGCVLILGFAGLLWMTFQTFGSLTEATHQLSETRPDAVSPPNLQQSREWISWMLLVGLGGALYPQTIQRIYAARSPAILRKSLAVMAFLPLTTTLIAVFFGIVAAAHISQTEVQADNILAVVCRHVQEQGAGGRALVVILFAAILAALMSTADSVLLSVSSMLTNDIYAPLRRGASEADLTRFGKMVSWVLISIATIFAIRLKDMELVTLLKWKFDLLVQLAPLFVLGLHWRRLSAAAGMTGLLAGVTVAVTLVASGNGMLHGVHAGLYGLAVNLLISIGLSFKGLENETDRQATL